MKPIDEMTNDDLRREIAERRGWRTERRTDLSGWRTMFRVIEPNGEPVSPTWHTSADTAWRYALIPGRVSNWPEDVKAALGLFQDSYVQIEHRMGQWRVSPNYLTDEGDDHWVMPCVGEDLPRLLCEAWLLRQRKREELRAAGRL